MLKRYFSILIIVVCFTFQGCAELVAPGGPGSAKPTGEMKQTALDRELYEVYEKRNTMGGYEEFIAKYPFNHFVYAARREIENLRFAEAEKRNTLEGYLEFIQKNPHNLNVSKAQTNIEQIELVYCKKENTTTCYKGFISKYPESMFLNEAREYLQELEIKQFDQELRENYGFDLLLYRLNLNRLKQEWVSEGKVDMGDFTFFASFTTRERKRYFQTHLTFQNDRALSKTSSGDIQEEIFNDILSRQLEYLNARFKGKQKIDGFSFELALFPVGTYKKETLFECYFPLDEVDHFVKERINKEALIKKSIIIPHSTTQPPVMQEAKPRLGQQEGTPPKLQETVAAAPLKWTSGADGLAKGGKFVRTAPPAFSFVCPEDWTVERTDDQFVFNGKDPSGLPSMHVMVTKIIGDERVYLKSFAEVITGFLRKGGGSNINVFYNKPTDVYEGFSAYEFEINYKPKGGKTMPRLTTYINVIAKDGYAIILEGESSGDIDYLKMIYETLNLKP